MLLTLVTALRSVAGEHRPGNQDSAGCARAWAFVADGVGGNAGGDVASGTVVHRLADLLAGVDPAALPAEGLRDVVAAANADLALGVRARPELAGMATTLTGVVCGDDELRLVHVGDSRAYLLRDGAGRRVSRDDSLVQLLVEAGLIDPADAFAHPRRNVIVHCLAGRPTDPAHVTVQAVPARPGDRWLLASDGLTDFVPEADVLGLLGAHPDPEQVADALVAAALHADARDNVTVAVVDVVRGAGGAAGVRVVGAAGREDDGTARDDAGHAGISRGA